MSSGQSSEMDVEIIVSENHLCCLGCWYLESTIYFILKMKNVRKRKRSTCSQGLPIEEALDLPFHGSSIVEREPSLIPPIVTLTPARTTSAAQVKFFIIDLPIFPRRILYQDFVTVDQFIRQVTANVSGPRQKPKFLTTRKLQNIHTSSASSTTRMKVYPRRFNKGRASKTSTRDRKPITLSQRLSRAAILSHVETERHSSAISPSLLPLNFVPLHKFATPPSRKRSAPNRGKSSSEMRSHLSHLEFSANPRFHKRYQSVNHHIRQPASHRSGCLPLSFIPFLEAEDAYNAMFSWVLSFGAETFCTTQQTFLNVRS